MQDDTVLQEGDFPIIPQGTLSAFEDQIPDPHKSPVLLYPQRNNPSLGRPP